jgi:Ca2+/Na+ antiporter
MLTKCSFLPDCLILQVGLNSVLGGAMFVSSVVAGSVGLVVSGLHSAGSLHLDRNCFLRDVGFFMVTLVSLLLILIVGRISLWGAIAYLSLYLVYGCSVAAGECVKKRGRKNRQSYALEPLLLSKSCKPTHPWSLAKMHTSFVVQCEVDKNQQGLDQCWTGFTLFLVPH